jgi:hypothetical protein
LLVASAFLAKLAAEQRRTAFTKADKTRPAASTTTDRSCPETSPHPNLRKLIAKLLLPLQPDPAFI